MPENLLESELFGYETITLRRRYPSQPRSMVEKGEFREDLNYRLRVVPLRIPPLRERRDDIKLLAQHFAGEFGVANAKPRIELDRGAVELLSQQAWPGNVRQLQNFIERLVVLSEGPHLG